MKNIEQEVKKKFEFGVSLRFEMFYALQSFFDEDSRIHQNWKKQALNSMPKSFLSSTYPLSGSPHIWPVIADVFTTTPIDVDFEELLESFSKIPISRLQFEVLNGAIHYPDIVEKALSTKDLKSALARVPKKKQEWLAHIGLYPYKEDSPTVESLELLIKSPKQFKVRVKKILETFWQNDFEKTWNRLNLSYQRSSVEKENLFHSCSLAEFAKQLLLKIEFNNNKQSILALRGGSITKYKDVDSSYMFPSAFNERKFWTTFQVGNKYHLFISIFDPSIQVGLELAGEKNSLPDIDPYLIFKALGDTTRYAMIQLISDSPKTSFELAKILSVSKPTVSHHLHLLRQAHLVIETPVSGSVELSIKRGTLEKLSELTLQQLLHGKHNYKHRKENKK